MSGATALPLPKGEPEALTEVSNGLSRVVGRAEQTHIYADGPSSPVIADTWTGEAAEARAKEAGTLKNRLDHATTKLPPIGSALTTYRDVLAETIDNVKLWQQRWDEAQDSYLAKVRQLNHEPDQEGLDKQAIADDWADERDAEHRRLRELYAVAIDDLHTAGRTAATEIRGQCDAVVPADKAGSREEIGAHVLRDMDLAGGEAMTELAESMREDFLTDFEAVASSDDPAVLEDFVEKYGDYAKNPHFAYVMASHMGADGFMRAFTDLGLANIRYGHDRELADQQQAVMEVLGTIYVAASGPADGDIPRHGYNAEAIEDWRENTWFPALTESGRSWHSLEDEGAAAGPYYGYYAQGLMLMAAAENGVVPDGSYMRHVGADMVAWDSEFTGERDWDFAIPGLHKPNLIGYEDDSAHGVLAEDPLYALLYAASKNEDSTYALLNTGVGSGDDRLPVVSYLIEQRGATMAYEQPFADNGQLLSETVARYGKDRTDYQSTALASHYLHSYIETVGTGKFADGSEIGEHTLAGARTATGDLVAAHIEDFIRAANDGDENVGHMGQQIGEKGEGPQPYQIYFDDRYSDLFAKFFGDLALDRPDEIVTADNTSARDNPPALQRVFNAAVAHNAVALNQAFGDPDGNPINVMDRGAGFLTYLTESAGLGRTEAAAAQDAYNEYVKTLLESGAGMVPVGSIPVAGPLADTVYSLATDKIIDSLVDTDHAAREEVTHANLSQALRDLLHDQAQVAIIEAGAWEEGKDPVTWAQNHELSSSAQFVKDGEMLPLETILENPAMRDALFNQFMEQDDGGRTVMRELEDQIEEAFGSGGVYAEDDYKADGK